MIEYNKDKGEINMMKIIFNQDGSIESITIPESIQQGNDGVDEIFVKWNGYSNTDYTCDAVFTLPNGDTNTLVATTSGSGFLITLTEAQTLYAGKLLASFRLKDLNTTLFSYQYEFQINPTGADIDETTITIAQYNSIVQAMNSYLLLDGGTLNQDSSISVETSDATKKKSILDGNGLELYIYAVGGVGTLKHTFYKAGEIYNYPASLTLPQTSGTLALVSQLDTKQNKLYRHTLSISAYNGGWGIVLEVINASSSSLSITGVADGNDMVFASATTSSAYKNIKYIRTASAGNNKIVCLNQDVNGLKIRVYAVDGNGTLDVEPLTTSLIDSVEEL